MTWLGKALCILKLCILHLDGVGIVDSSRLGGGVERDLGYAGTGRMERLLKHRYCWNYLLRS